MSSIEAYRAALTALPAADWEPYLLAHANLPGPRGNLELAAAGAELGAEARFRPRPPHPPSRVGAGLPPSAERSPLTSRSP